MAEVLSNGTFTGSIDSDYWSKWGGSSTEMFVHDSSEGGVANGSAKATTGATAGETTRYSMYQSFTMTYASDIDTAVIGAWAKFDRYGSSDDEATFWVQLRDPSETWHTVKKVKYTADTEADICDDEDVKTILQDGGNGTWYFGVTCDMYHAPGTVGYSYGWFDDLSLDIDYEDYDSTTETITLTDATTESKAISTSDTETITLSDLGAATISADPTFGYYFGDYSGKVYAEDSSYKSDDGTDIDAYWESKETDFAEEGMEPHDKFKTIYKVRLWYVDISSITAVVAIGIKADGASSWTTYTGNVGGSGNDTTKCKDFYLIKTGHSFKFRIENDSSDNEFQWSALEVFYTLGGDYFPS